jgi:hypothetical protein
VRTCLKQGAMLFVELDNRRAFITNEAGKRHWHYCAGHWLTLSQHHYDPKARVEKTLDIGIDLHEGTVRLFQ